ncbi:MAG TPA: hypothetical protein VFN68_14720 [Acidimicrobiales bacterium]|nr:hypothetical protein [Acidimicrobiales bacterium]
MRTRTTRSAGAVASAVALSATTILTIGGPGVAAAGAVPATSAAPPCGTTPYNLLPSTLPNITIFNPWCDPTSADPTATFASLDGSTVYAGIIDDSPAGGFTAGGQSAYRVEVPRHWNGTLVMFAHGYAGTGTTVGVDDATLRQYYVDHGFAWAASSYAMNGYDVGTGVVDTHDLLEAFPSITGHRPRSVLMSGLSMGGAITAVEIEHYRNTFVGAMPYCGVIGGNDLFNFFLGANVTAAAVTGTSISFPSVSGAAAYAPTYDAQVLSELPKLGISTTSPHTTDLTALGREWANAVEHQSGGIRPGFASAISYWDAPGFPSGSQLPFLFGLYPGLTGGGIGYLTGNVTDNTRTFYDFSPRPGYFDPGSLELNEQALRVSRTVPFSTDPTATELPDVTGTPGIPVVSVHGIGDLFVPFSMEQDYARLADAHGQGYLFVSRAIREVGHCDYTQPELQSAFASLVNWIHTGQRAAGDNILDPRAVSSPTFGCRFTVGPHPAFQGVACPTGGDRGQQDGQGQNQQGD